MFIGLATKQMLSDWLTSGEHFVSRVRDSKRTYTCCKYKLLTVDEQNVHEKIGLKIDPLYIRTMLSGS